MTFNLRRSVIFSITLLLTFLSRDTHAQWSLYRDLAFSRFADVIVTAEATLKETPDRVGSALPPLCYAYYKIRRYDKIFWCVEQLEARIRAGDATHSDTLIFASDIRSLPGMIRSSAYLDFGQYDRAVGEAETALGLVNDKLRGGMMDPLRYRLELLPTLAVAAALAGDRKKSESYLKQLEDIQLGFMGAAMRNHQTTAIARVHMALGNCGKVLEYFSEGERAGLLLGLGNILLGGGDDRLSTQYDLSQGLMVAKCLKETGKTKEATAALDRILKNPRIELYGDVHWVALYERGLLAEAEGQVDKAMELYRRAIEIIEQQRSTINAEAGKIGFVGDKQQLYFRLIALLVALGRVADAFDYVERSKSRALVDMLASKKDFAARGADPEKIKIILAQLDAAELASRAQEDTAKGSAQAGVRAFETARQGIQATAPELSTLVSVSSVPAEELKALIGEDETLVGYYYQGRELYVFVLTRGGALQSAKLDGSGLVGQVQAFRRAIEEVGLNAWQRPALALHERLWKPVEGMVTTKNVIIVAHGVLHYLPFGALQSDDGRFLIDRYGLRFLPSASVLKFLRPALAKKEAPLLVFGNPDLGDPKLDLQFAEEEARTVAGLFPESRTLVRKDASETNFKKAGGIFQRIHFATHGKFQADSPLESGLYLTKDGDNDGVLTVGELYSMNLDADLVTLSACETGLGKIASGDDVVGFTRGFLYAGSRSIIASLWSVDDKATAELMKMFYDNLSRTTKQEALRQAQIKARASFPHPFFWAAFQLTGRSD